MNVYFNFIIMPFITTREVKGWVEKLDQGLAFFRLLGKLKEI